MLSGFRTFTGLLIGLVLCCPAFAADDFRQGVAAFQSQQYERALQHFNSAYEAGPRTPVLHYNLGVTNFRLKRYERSLGHFRQIADDASWGALAHYNMGLIEERRGRSAQALSHFRVAHERAGTPRVQQLTAAKLRAIESAAAERTTDEGWSGLVATAGGFDDNVLLLDDHSLVRGSNADDYYMEVRGASSRYLQGDFESGWRLGLAGYHRAYGDLDDFNVSAGELGVFYGRLMKTWHVQVGGKLDAQLAGGEEFSRAGVFSVEGVRTFGRWALRLREELSVLEGGAHYAFVGGLQNVAGVEITRRLTSGRLRLGYELEFNDRDDLVLVDEFFSYSPVRHKLFAGVRQNVSGQLRIGGRIEYRRSAYPDANTQVNPDGSVTVARRDEDRITGALRIDYEFTPNWDLFGEYLYATNDSNFDRYSYENNQVLMGLQKSF